MKPNGTEHRTISIVIPTYNREQVLLNTINYLLELNPAPAEILIIDQTQKHVAETENALSQLDRAGKIRWVRLAEPSITRAMNVGLKEARHNIVLFIDDDIIPGASLIAAHQDAHAQEKAGIIAGQVLQPGEEPLTDEQETGEFSFRSNKSRVISEFMGGNFSVKRNLALKLGGFDENFVHVAYRFEAEFADRARASGEKIFFEPKASIRHLKESRGGTRSFGSHLTTIKPSHAVGAYYFLLRSKGVTHRVRKIFARPLRSVRTKHHLSRPWWIIPTLIAEVTGLAWAVMLALRGPKLITGTVSSQERYD